jgi:endonuclease-3
MPALWTARTKPYPERVVVPLLTHGANSAAQQARAAEAGPAQRAERAKAVLTQDVSAFESTTKALVRANALRSGGQGPIVPVVITGSSAVPPGPGGPGTSAGRRPTVSARPRSATGRAKLAAQRLADEYPGNARALCELNFTTPWELLVATVLSAQTTDERVNSVVGPLFAQFPLPEDLAGASPERVEEIIRPTGFFRVKAKNIVALAQAVRDRFGGEVPTAMAELVTLPGVGRKTANVVLSVAFDLPGLPVDTHVGRLSRLLGLTMQTDPEKVEAELCAALPSREWGALSLRLILHGRRVCIARRPRCSECVLADFCPSAAVPVRPSPPR